MANWVSFRGVSTSSMTGVAVATMPSPRKAGKMITQYKVKGRDGILHTDDGFDNIDITVRLMLLGENATTRQTVNAWADGTGKLFTSDDSSKCWLASVNHEIIWYRDEVGGKFYDIADIVFNCQPIMRETIPAVYTYTANATFQSIGSYEAYPKLEIKGNGSCTVTLNGTEMSFTGLQTAHPVTVDCENGYIYNDDETAATMTGDFPRMVLGTNTLTIGGGTTQVKITPNWGWV